ncbi:cyclic nucleotide-binding/CBS domain-containing protein [Leucothrix sargassi]|nr:cyclic nucleotide-binding/CBS domain-containing protein [Leucothrix sargassi]
MEVEQLAIYDFLSKCMPLNKLSKDALSQLVKVMDIRYVRRGQTIFNIGDTNPEVFIIRQGAIEFTDAAGNLQGRYEEGEWIGFPSVLSKTPVEVFVKTIEDSLLYCLPNTHFLALLEQDEGIRHFFSEKKQERLRNALRENRTGNYSLLALHLKDLARPGLMLPPDTSIHEAAVQLSEQHFGSAMIIEDDQLIGIVSDRDFRQRAIVPRLDFSTPVKQIMTPNPYTLDANAPGSEAILLMARRNIHHIPVLHPTTNKVIGVVSNTDLLRIQSHNAVYLVGDIHKANDVETLQRLSSHLPKTLVNMVRSSLPAYDIAHAISSIGQAITRRLLTLAEKQYGPPPVPYAFVVAGSMARREQTAHTDQDNGLILSDEFDPELHDEYFLNISNVVCDGLNACSYIYCPGNIMATNKEWRQPVSVWRTYFNDWIDRPQPQALLHASTFFDLRHIYGDESLLEGLKAETLKKTKSGSLFQAYLAGNALGNQPPLGIFKGFVLEKNGDNGKALDFKKRGVTPVIDLARLYSLVMGLPQTNTFERLDAILEAPGGISDDRIADLKDAFEFISMTRLEHQAKQIEAGKSPDNFVPPEELSALQRRHLKDAFEVVSTVQSTMSHNFQANRFR